MKITIQTASHNLGNGTKFGSTPMETTINEGVVQKQFEVLPTTRNMNALEIIGEAVVLMLAGHVGEVDVHINETTKYRLKWPAKLPHEEWNIKIEKL